MCPQFPRGFLPGPFEYPPVPFGVLLSVRRGMRTCSTCPCRRPNRRAPHHRRRTARCPRSVGVCGLPVGIAPTRYRGLQVRTRPLQLSSRFVCLLLASCAMPEGPGCLSIATGCISHGIRLRHTCTRSLASAPAYHAPLSSHPRPWPGRRPLTRSTKSVSHPLHPWPFLCLPASPRFLHRVSEAPLSACR